MYVEISSNYYSLWTRLKIDPKLTTAKESSKDLNMAMRVKFFNLCKVNRRKSDRMWPNLKLKLQFALV